MASVDLLDAEDLSEVLHGPVQQREGDKGLHKDRQRGLGQRTGASFPSSPQSDGWDARGGDGEGAL